MHCLQLHPQFHGYPSRVFIESIFKFLHAASSAWHHPLVITSFDNIPSRSEYGPRRTRTLIFYEQHQITKLLYSPLRQKKSDSTNTTFEFLTRNKTRLTLIFVCSRYVLWRTRRLITFMKSVKSQNFRLTTNKNIQMTHEPCLCSSWKAQLD